MKKGMTTTVKQVAAAPIKQTLHPIKNFGISNNSKAATPKGQPKKK